MGETEEKSNGPHEGQEAEPKETDKMLNKDDTAGKREQPPPPPPPAKTETINETTKNPTSPDKTIINGEEIVNHPEQPTAITVDTLLSEPTVPVPVETATVTVSPVTPEGREVKPKKIPIGGIKMPGFFTRNKNIGSKGAEGDGADNELLENQDPDAKPTEDNINNENKARANFFSGLRNIRNPFKKQSSSNSAKSTENGNADTKNDETEKTITSPDNNDTSVNGGQQQPPKKGLLNAIRLPIANIIPKKLKPVSNGTNDDLELGNGPHNRAGLASMETLDDSLKDTEGGKDAPDHAVAKNGEDDLETVKLDNKDEKQQDKAEEAAADKPKTFWERIRAYRCSIDDIAIVAGILIFLLLVGVICAFTFGSKAALKSAPIKDGRFIQAVTSCGFVEGLLDDGAFGFRGIPYAVPPIGENRWRPARVIDNIDLCWNGTFVAHNSTPNCWQIYSDGSINGTEDCLTLDVITPHVRYDNPLPVVVLIGAESFTGNSPTKLRPSNRYARSRDVVFVRPNFRIGTFGFLAADALSKSAHPPSSGNYGLSDIIAALQWIEHNIAHFGGDRNSVTLFGHRTGATLVSALVTSPKAKDLFARAWVTSGAALFPGKPLIESERANLEYLNNLKCTDATCLREVQDIDALEALPDTWNRVYPDLPSAEENATTQHEWLVLDGDILQQHPVDVWNRELGGPPKMVIGTTAHESHSEKLLNKYKEWTPELVRKHIEESRIGKLGLTDEALKRYNATYQGLVAMISDIRTVCPLLTIARLQKSVPFYVVTQTGGNLTIADVDADILAILGRYEAKTPEQRRYVSAIQQLFYHYVSHGEMRQFDPRRRVFNIGQDAWNREDYPNCDFWIEKDIVPRYARLD